MLFSARIARDDPWTVVHLSGELDLLSRPVAAGLLDGVMNAGACRIVLDLADLTFIDTCGASALLRMREKAERTGVDLMVANGSPLAVLVLRTSGFHEVITAPMVLAC